MIGRCTPVNCYAYFLQILYLFFNPTGSRFTMNLYFNAIQLFACSGPRKSHMP
ncbi:hypothetical protein D3OALGA1CA_3833 [Olavius algarvensis associated proteobacterium Delta 3]|nr:hypothetical protein D3OALGA1CA_3833 [Olavius algarvensis associated proteobacterium Delta 3]CAB5150777.1 hypothetical protein D3OALGB2SA_4792 [Olavius algarvensis associated proteobacterium Delta 3]